MRLSVHRALARLQRGILVHRRGRRAVRTCVPVQAIIA